MPAIFSMGEYSVYAYKLGKASMHKPMEKNCNDTLIDERAGAAPT